MAFDFDLAVLRAAASEGRIQWRQHALERLLERGLSRAEIVRAILEGDVIETYLDDRPYPSCLVLHAAPKPVHVVAAADPQARICHVITAYHPDLDHFESDFRTRRT